MPIAGTRILVPFRMTHPTPFGPAVLGSDDVRDDSGAAKGCEDAVSLLIHLAPPFRGEVGLRSNPGEGLSPRAPLVARALHPAL